MPYDRNDDLPQAVRNHLPERAQNIYREAFIRLGSSMPMMPNGNRSPGRLDRREAQVPQAGRSLGAEYLM